MIETGINALVLDELREQTKWLRFLALREVPAVVAQQLRDDTQRQAFELSDGTRSTRAIAEMTGVSAKTISNWWQRWISVGLAQADASGRATRLLSLKSLGMEVRGLKEGGVDAVADE